MRERIPDKSNKKKKKKSKRGKVREREREREYGNPSQHPPSARRGAQPVTIAHLQTSSFLFEHINIGERVLAIRSFRSLTDCVDEMGIYCSVELAR